LISLEQIRLLETKIAKAVDYIERLTKENAALTGERSSLQKKLDANQKRLDELEMLVMRFKEDQGRIEDGIIAALDRLSQFEEAFENSLRNEEKITGRKQAIKREKPELKESKEFFEINEEERGRKTPPEGGDSDDIDSSSVSELDIF
jgi:FtsZ-binding cell division protein ZapB